MISINDKCIYGYHFSICQMGFASQRLKRHEVLELGTEDPNMGQIDSSLIDRWVFVIQ